MTENEIDAGIGRLARKYAEINREIACVRHRLSEHGIKFRALADAINMASQGHAGAPQAACAAIDWDVVCGDASRLPELATRREELEGCLREAGLSEVIQPTWKR